jgi:two-component system chemotaxis response regulator CheY
MGVNVDPKTAMIQEGTSLGGWATVSATKTIKFPIGTKSGRLTFEIPMISMEFAKKFTHEYYGFKEEARILVVDDSMVARRYSRTCLANAGYFNIVECPDGQAGLTKIISTLPPIELVIADWHMPVMSGIELLKRVRSEPQFHKLPIIMLTGEKNKEEVVNAIKEGATGYLVKPSAPDSFFKSLRKAGGRA